MGVDLEHSLYALDSTTIDLCLSLFPWARFRQHKAAVKMHTLLDLHGNIPTFIRITDGKVHDFNILDEIVPETGAFYVMDRGYIDFDRLYFFTLCSAFFVVRTKENVLLQRRYSHPVDKSTGVRSDHNRHPNRHRICQSLSGCIATGELPGCGHQQASEVSDQQLCSSSTDYRPNLQMPGQVELFFRWVKQHLRIKSFFGTSDNAVKTQIWIAVSIYLLVAIVRKRLGLRASLYQILQILSVTLFEKVPVLRALEASSFHDDLLEDPNQLILFNF